MQRINDYVKMHKASNDNNMESFKKILPYFFLNDESNQLVLDSIDNRSDILKDGDTMLQLGDDLRAIYEIDNYNPDDDIGYQRYRDVLYDHGLWGCSILRSSDTYRSGVYQPEGDKNSYKLFKYLKKHGVSQEHIESITTAKAPDKQYLVISRNPIDYLFCATNQSFTSCLNLESDYERALYLSLPATMTDNNRAMVFLTTGRLKRYTIKGNEFKHFNVISRAWGILNEEDALYIDRYYPNRQMNFAYNITKSDLININATSNSSSLLKGKHNNQFIKNIAGNKIHIFQDTVSIVPDGDLYTYKFEYCPDITGYEYIGYVGNNFSDCRYEYYDGFESIVEREQLGLPRQVHCTCCGIVRSVHDMIRTHGNHYCDICIEKEYFWCDNCSGWHSKYRKTKVKGGYVCRTCFNRYYGLCKHCGQYRYARGRPYREAQICDDCFCEHYMRCNVCRDYFKRPIYGATSGICDKCGEVTVDTSPTSSQQGIDNSSTQIQGEPGIINMETFERYVEFQRLYSRDLIRWDWGGD